jgi:hypothetical protein
LSNELVRVRRRMLGKPGISGESYLKMMRSNIVTIDAALK